MFKKIFLLFFTLNILNLVSSFTAGNVKQNTLLPLPIKVNGQSVSTSVALDSNWRWLHNVGGYENCYSSSWVSKFCPNEAECSKNCQIEGVTKEDWLNPYGISVNGNSLRLNYVTKGQYGDNVGSRVYLVADNSKSYEGFDMNGKEISFTVDVSNLPCGLNGAVYFTEMPLNNPYDNSLDASFGVNYGDAQCPKDIKYLEGNANMGRRGTCANEYDIWEANSRATSMAMHPCKVKGVYGCENDVECGVGSNRYKGVCDKDGADFNLNRHGKTKFYGRGSEFEVDTTKPFQVTIQFHLDPTSGQINKVKRFYKQNGKVIDGGEELTPTNIPKIKKEFDEYNHFDELGGFKTMTESFKRKLILVLSVWDDNSVNMRWLDSVYPIGSTKSSDYRGPCSQEDTKPVTLRSKYPNSYVVYSDIQINNIVTPTPTPTPTPNPVPPKKGYWRCQSCDWKS